MKLIKVGAIIDFYVSKKKYNSLKKEASKRRYVERVMNEYLTSLIGTIENGVHIRYATVESNNFWGGDLCLVNDLGYCNSNMVEPRKDDKLTIRVFHVDLIGVESMHLIKFKDITKENFILKTSNVISF